MPQIMQLLKSCGDMLENDWQHIQLLYSASDTIWRLLGIYMALDMLFSNEGVSIWGKIKEMCDWKIQLCICYYSVGQ